jgi:hypothetical protein
MTGSNRFLVDGGRSGNYLLPPKKRSFSLLGRSPGTVLVLRDVASSRLDRCRLYSSYAHNGALAVVKN